MAMLQARIVVRDDPQQPSRSCPLYSPTHRAAARPRATPPFKSASTQDPGLLDRWSARKLKAQVPGASRTLSAKSDPSGGTSHEDA
jgi:hypothetical protein